MNQEQLPAVNEPGMLAADPRRYVQQATKLATELGAVIKDRKLYSNIGGKAYVTVEGWTLLANMLGVVPIVVWSRRCQATNLEDDLDGGWEARVEVHNANGQLVGAGEAMCVRREKTWQHRDDFALRAMAQTRAISRALRNPLGFVVKLAGYSPETTAEEAKAS